MPFTLILFTLLLSTKKIIYSSRRKNPRLQNAPRKHERKNLLNFTTILLLLYAATIEISSFLVFLNTKTSNYRKNNSFINIVYYRRVDSPHNAEPSRFSVFTSKRQSHSTLSAIERRRKIRPQRCNIKNNLFFLLLNFSIYPFYFS